ncbi:Nn.00g023960.m01.CDS01 [Neocucurbitaria sp. VM-36]
MPRLVRRAPLSERIKAYTDPSDWLIWISEELNSSDWDEFASSYALYVGFGANLLFIIAQANSGASTSYSDSDGVFTEVSGPGWIKWMLNLLVLVLGGASLTNAWLVWGKRRHYRLFEQSVEIAPQTPSAKRVRVDSSPAGASPLGFIKNIMSNSAAARAHPDAERDVWEIAVWDPNPLCLELFCLFSPLHVVLYYLNLPVAPLDPRPSVKVTTTIFIGAILSLHLWWLRSSFTQQTKDNAIISRGVLHEYDNKFVHPALQKPCRDVGIQTISRKRNRDSSVGVKGSSDDLASEVVTYTPTTIINRTFRTNPNANYAAQYDPDNLSSTSIARSSQQTPSLRPGYHTTSSYTSTSTATGADFSSPIRASHTPNPFRQAPSIPRTSDGGYLGIKQHAASPLRKSSSTSFIRDSDRGSNSGLAGGRFDAYGQPIDGGGRGRDSLGGAGERRQASPSKREGSPLKRTSMPNGERPLGQAERLGRSSGYGGLGVGRRESGRF